MGLMVEGVTPMIEDFEFPKLTQQMVPDLHQDIEGAKKSLS